MKRGTIDHPKTLLLADLLGLERWEATGILESLWHWTSHYAIQGNIGKWPDAVIAAGIGWRRRPAGELVDALAAAGWLDRVDKPGIRLAVHDLSDHADNTWRQNLVDCGLGCFWNGHPARGQVGRPRKSKGLHKETPEKLQRNSRKTTQPEPEPEPEPLETLELSLASLARPISDDGFETFWSAYPRTRRLGKAKAREQWARLRPDAALRASILAALAWQSEQPAWLEAGGKFIPHPERYLRNHRWEDERSPVQLHGTTPKTAGNAEAIDLGLEIATRHDR